MARIRNCFIVIVIGVGLLGLPPASSVAVAAPEQVMKLEEGLTELSGWFGSLEREGRLGTSLPLLDDSIGSGLDLADTFTAALRNKLAAAADPSDVAGLAAQVDGFDGPVTVGEPGETFDVTATFATSPADDTGPIFGFDVVTTLTRTISAAEVGITAPATPTTPEVTLKSADGAGVPLDLTLAATFHVRYDDDQNYFFVVANNGGTTLDPSDDLPRIDASAVVDDYAFTSDFSAAIGVGDIEFGPGSSMSLAADVLGNVTDSNGDEKLAFREPGTPGGALISAELELTPDQNVSFIRSGAVDASLNLQSPIITGTETATLVVSGDLADADPDPVVSGASIDELDQFENVEPVDLLNGLIQYATLLRAVQTNPNVNFELPLVRGRISDIVLIHDALATFIDDRIQEIPPGADLTEDPNQLVDFGTVQELIAKMEAASGGIPGLKDTNLAEPGKITPSYDTGSDKLTLQLGVVKTLDGSFQALPTPDPDMPAGFDTAAGLPEFGSELRRFAGLAGGAPGPLGTVNTPATSPAQRKTAYDFQMPLIVNLADSTEVGDDATTEGVVEFESPMVFERFQTSTAGAAPEITLTGLVRSAINANGTIGFVGVNITGTDAPAPTGGYVLDQTAPGTPMQTIDVDATRAGLPATLPIGTLLQRLVDDDGNDGLPDNPENTSNDPVIPAQPSAKLDSVLQVDAPAPPGESHSLTENPGTITIAWPGISTALDGSNVTLNATAQMLKDLDIVPPDISDPNSTGSPSALLGKLMDTIDNVTDKIDAIPGASGMANDLLNTKLPLVGKSANDLFGAADKLAEKIDEVRTGEIPVTLQDLEQKLQTELGIGAGALNFSLKDVIVGGKPELIFRVTLADQFVDDVPLNVDLPADFGGANIAGISGTGAIHVAADALLKLNIPVTLNAPSASDLTDASPQILNSSGLELNATVTGADNLSLAANLGPLTLALGPNPGKAGPAGQLGIGGSFTAYPGGSAVLEGSEVAQSFDAFKSSLAPRLSGGDSGNGGADFDCTPQDTADSSPATPPTVTGQIGCLAMPLSVAGLDLGTDPDERYLTVTINEGATPDDPPTFNAVPPAGLTVDDLLANLPNFGSMKDGITKLKAILDLALKGATFGAQLPLVGDKIAAGAKVIEKVQALVENPLGAVPGLPTDLTNVRVDWVLNNIRPALFSGLCPGDPATCLLRDSSYAAPGLFYPADADAGASATDIRIVMLCDADKHVCNLDNPATPNNDTIPGDENEAEAITDLREVTFEFELGQGNRDPVTGECQQSGSDATPCQGVVTFPLDFGLPGLNLSAAGSVEAQAGWSLQLGFGVNNDVGFFVLDNPLPSTGTPDLTGGNYDPNNEAEPELKVGAGVSLHQNEGTPQVPEITGAIGFLEVSIEDKADTAVTHDTHKSLLSTHLESNLEAPDAAGVCEPATVGAQRNCSGRITIDQIPGLNPAEHLNPKMSADADIDLELKSGIDGSVGEKLPNVRADFLLNWEFGSPGTAAGSDPECGTPPGAPGEPVGLGNIGAPRLCFNEVGIDPGTLFSQTLNPIFSGVKKFTEPVDPIREFIFAPIPVLSDLSRLFGGGDVTFVDLAEIFGEVDLSLLKDINQLVDVINNLPTAAGDYFTIGNFGVIGERAKAAATTPDQVTSLIQGGAATLEGAGPPGGFAGEAENRIGDDDDKAKFQTAVDGGAGDTSGPDITFPILDEPGCVFGMIFGGDCTLFLYSPDPLEMDFDYEQSFGPFFGVLYVTVGGFAGARARISLGFDTRGFRELYESLSGGGGVGDAGTVLNGIFLNDLAADGSDPNELEVFAGITAGAKLSVLLAEFGARGGIEAKMGLNLHDGPEVDGKLRINEIFNKIHVPFCLFDVTGELSAFLEVYVTLGVCPFCAEKEFELARVVLLEFSESCPQTPPDLVDVEGDNVLLNVGVDAGDRGSGWGTGADDETFVVRETSVPSAVTKDFTITAYGFTQKASGKRLVIRDAQGGSDSFLFQGVKPEGAVPGQNAGDPDIAAPFTAPVIAQLGAGADSITTGTGVDHIDGGPDNDTINVGEGNDGSGSLPSLPPGTLVTAAGVRGGALADTILGGAGDDNLFGDDGNDTIDAGLGEDDVDGGAGNDYIQGGSDVLVRPDQPTPCPATPCDQFDSGDDLIGGPGRDQIDGGSGDDDIWGDEGDLNNDTDGDDPASDGDNDDTIIGGLGSDTVFAGSGNDSVNGAGDGTLILDLSRDRLHGNGGADKLYGRGGNDNVWGGSGIDELFGDDGHDNLFGQADGDSITGGTGDDDAYGGGGDDHISGQAGNDDLVGGLEGDHVFGGTGNDVIVGDDGTIDDGDVADDPGTTADSGAATRTEAVSQDTGADDHLFGEDGDDRMFGEGGLDEMFGGSGIDFMHGNGARDEMFGDNENDEMYGDGANDLMHGGPHDDLMFGNSGQDEMLGQTGSDRMIGGSSGDAADDAGAAGDLGANTGDKMYGGSENDRMIGDNGTINSINLGDTGLAGTFGDDIMDGGAGDDTMHGQEGNDLMFGGLDYDQMFGDLGGDTMSGQGGPDFMLGDEGTITPSTDPVAVFPTNAAGERGAPNNVVSLDDPADNSDDPNTDGGLDFMFGDGADDHMYGGAANDEMSGGWADDVMEGNSGQDKMWGASETADDGLPDASDGLDLLLDGQDDMIGGSSTSNPSTIDLDEGEIVMMGNAQHDVMTGDNATIEREVDGSVWAIDEVTLGVARTVTLLDTEKSGADLDAVSGPDYMLGNLDNDRMHGQGAGDRVLGNDDQDYIEGNQDGDWLEGNNHQDDIIGGSRAGGQLDDGDYIFGGGASDVITGDNAVINRLVGVSPVQGNSPVVEIAPYSFRTNRLEIPAQREVKLGDLGAYNAAHAGPDQISGGAASDVAFGQDEDDWVSGGPANDYMEGNGHTDRLFGDEALLAVPAAIVASFPGTASTGDLLNGPVGAEGQDDQIGGSSIKAHRDANDFIYGNGEQDFQLGDNGTLFRTVDDVGATTDAGYLHYLDANETTIQRKATRYDVATADTSVFGDDEMYGQDGDDYQYGQDGDDLQLGGNDNDDMFGELGDDEMYGENGQDAMIGDRGVITDDLIQTGDPDDHAQFTYTTNGPGFFSYTAFTPGTLHRFVDLKVDGDGDVDGDGNPVESPGLSVGGQDFMRGGNDHDSMHGAFGDDLMNGDAYGDFLFGDDGADAMWGGTGGDGPSPLGAKTAANDPFTDIMFGGYGGNPNLNQGAVTGGADMLDYRPRPGPNPADPAAGSPDPAIWFVITDTDDLDASNNQHHQNIDWIYGGWNRDVLQADIGKNGPDGGDRLLDWNGAFNLYTHCHASYGGDNDIRAHSPSMQQLLQRIAFGTGAGATLEEAQTSGTSAFRELALVYPGDKENAGKAYPTTPGHFEDFACTP